MMDIWAHVLPKDQLKRILETETSRDRETPQGQEVSEQDWSRGDGTNSTAQSDGCPSPSSRGQHQVFELGHGVCGPFESGPRFQYWGPLWQHPRKWTNSNAKERTTPLRHHLVVTMIDLLLQRVHSPDRSQAGERTSSTGSTVSALRQQQSLSFSLLEPREKAADSIQDTTNAVRGGLQNDPGNQNMLGGQSSDPEVPQLEEDVHRHGQSCTLPMDSEPPCGTKPVASLAAFSISQFLAAHTGSPTTIQSPAQSSCQEHPTTSCKALRLCVNSNGLNLLMLTAVVWGLAWLSQVHWG